MGVLDGHVAVVTGGGRGIGRGIATELAAAGAAVAVIARSPDELAQTVTLIERGGGRALALPADVTDASAMTWAVRETEARVGPVTLLVNNAGIAGPLAPLWETDLEAWWRCLEVHLKGAAIGAKAVLPGMIARQRGRVVNIGSSVALAPTPYLSAYGIAKAALLLRFTEDLALETREHGIAVFALDPGGVRTAMITDAILASPLAPMALPAVGRLGAEQVFTRRPEEAGALCVRLATGALDALAGRYFGVLQDFDQLIEDAHAMQHDDRYTLRLRL